MNGDVFYDTDCLSCFLSIDDVSILKKLFDKIVIPSDVYDEFSSVDSLLKRLDVLVKESFVEVVDTNVYDSCKDLSTKLRFGYIIDKPIGDGEAAAIALAVENDGILASNNTSDIAQAVNMFGIKRIKTGDILVKAFHCGLITEKKGNEMWDEMLLKKRYLTASSFSDYLEKNPDPIF